MLSTGNTEERLLTSEQVESPDNGRVSLIASILLSPWFSAAIIILICALTFGRTLGSYFLADDIGELRYIQQIFDGRWGMFWSNFYGNYMQVPNMSVYRPVLLLSLMFDYAIWKGNPLGYYLSNLTYFTASACLLATFIRQLCAGWGRSRAAMAALASAVLFATNPLHCESISWVVGRVDSACCTFYLAALCVFMSMRNKSGAGRAKFIAAGVALFTLAICTKEMAIGLAPVLAAIAFIFPETTQGAQSFVQRIKGAWSFSCPIWIATAVYFVVRLLSLGTLLGGYNGSVGASQTASAITRWLDGDTWRRFLMPFPLEIFSSGNSLEQALTAAYTCLIFLVFIRVLSNSIPWRWLAFIAFWAATQAAPIYRLWGLGANLEGARFCYFLTLSACSLLPIFLLAPENKLPKALSNKLTACALIALSTLAFITSKSAYATNLLWLHAGKEVKSVFTDALKLSKSCPPGEKMILLGVPKQHAGAHMILNGATLQMLLAPPFADKEYWEPFLTFDPILFGDENIVNGSRLRALVNSPGYKGPFVWSNARKQFVEVQLQAPNQVDEAAIAFHFDSTQQSATPCAFGHGEYDFASTTVRIKSPHDGDGVRLANLNVNPLASAYLKLSFKSSNNKIVQPFTVRWKAAEGDNSLAELADANNVVMRVPADDNADANTIRTIYIPLASNWHWYAHSRISELSLFVPAVQEITLTALSLVPAKDASPAIHLPGKTDNFGVSAFATQDSIDVTATQGEQLLLQLSKKHFFFDNFESGDDQNGVAAEYKQAGRSASFTIPSSDFSGEGYYQLRAKALDKNGAAVGDHSDTVTIWVSK